MPQFLTRLLPARPEMLTEGPTDEEIRRSGEHFVYHQEEMAKGRVILAGRTQDTGVDTFGIAILNAETLDEAEAFANNDPAVIHGVMTVKVFPYQIALFGPQNVRD